MFEIINKIIHGITLFVTTAILSISGLVPNSTQINPTIITLPTASVSIVPTVYKELITPSPTGKLILTDKLQQKIISPTAYPTPTTVPTTDPKKGPGGIAPGAYPVDSLTQEQKQWLWKFYGHEGNAPFGYGGETFVPTRVYIGSSKACFTFSGETVSEGVYNGRKPITFDASCSENATLFRWSVNGGILKYFDNLPSDSIVGDYLKTKIVTKCLRCNSPYETGEVKWKIKLEVVAGTKVGEGFYKPDYIEKEIRMKDQ